MLVNRPTLVVKPTSYQSELNAILGQYVEGSEHDIAGQLRDVADTLAPALQAEVCVRIFEDGVPIIKQTVPIPKVGDGVFNHPVALNSRHAITVSVERTQ